MTLILYHVQIVKADENHPLYRRLQNYKNDFVTTQALRYTQSCPTMGKKDLWEKVSAGANLNSRTHIEMEWGQACHFDIRSCLFCVSGYQIKSNKPNEADDTAYFESLRL